MTMSRRIVFTTTPLLLLTAALALSACGGGKGSAPAAADGSGLVSISGRAVDGPLQGATACYDLDDDQACGAGEPRSAPTAADGSYTLLVPAAQAGRHAVVVEVPASAIDADTTAPVGQAFVLRAPPAQTQGTAHDVFVSPLTTLVHALMVHGAATRADAEAEVRQSAGLGVSPLADFTRDSSAAASHAARVARIVQLAANEQMRVLATLAGTPDRNGATITTALLDRELQMTLAALLPAAAEAAREPALLAATGATLQSLLAERGSSLAAMTGLTPELVRTMAGMQRLAEPAPANPPVATAGVTTFSYTNADNWYYRRLQSSAADNEPDANNYVRYHDVRVASAAPNAASAPLPGVARAWATGNVQARDTDLFWNGSAWADCKLTDRYVSRIRDASGRGDYVYCNGRDTGVTQRRLEDISGQRIADVVRDKIRTTPGFNNGVAYANWGPSNLGLYGNATFPAGSYLILQTGTVLTTSVAYDVATSNQVVLYNAAVSAGGDVRSNPTLACGDTTQNTLTLPASTLEEMVSRMVGRPCTFNQTGQAPNQSLNPNEAWGFNSLFMGDLANTNTRPPNTGTFYTTAARLRVAFPGGNRALFYRCYVQTSNNSSRNCSVLGLGTWSIQALADGRILSFSTMPALAQRLGYARVFVERGGRVYHGYQNPVGGASIETRLNLPAANAVFEQLGLPRIRPVTQPGTATGQRAANLATLEGIWGANTGSDALAFRFGPDGRFWMAEAKPFQSTTREQTGTELGWFDHDPATGQVSTLLELDSTLTSGTSHPNAGDPPITITPTSISNGSGFSIGRLANDATGLIGMWAVASPTDLSVPHLVFYANGRVLLADHRGGDTPQCTATGEGPPGAEYASWTFDTDENVLTIQGKIHDTNGCAGLFDSSAASIAQGTDNQPVFFSVSFASDFLSMQLSGQRGTETWYRVPVVGSAAPP
jgi:trimeric autotransporter adhesin